MTVKASAPEPVATTAADAIETLDSGMELASEPSMSLRRRFEQVGAHVGGFDRVPHDVGPGRLATSRGWSVSSVAQSRNDDRNPCGTATIPCFLSSRPICSPPILAAALADEHDPTPAATQVPGRVEKSSAPARTARTPRVHLARLRRPHLAVRQGLPVPDEMLLGAEHRQEPVARVVRSPVHGDGPFQHGADAVTNDPGCRRLRVPDGGEDLEHVGARHLRDRHPPDPREDVHLEAAIPVPRHRRTAPPGALLLDHPTWRPRRRWGLPTERRFRRSMSLRRRARRSPEIGDSPVLPAPKVGSRPARVTARFHQSRTSQRLTHAEIRSSTPKRG